MKIKSSQLKTGMVFKFPGTDSEYIATADADDITGRIYHYPNGKRVIGTYFTSICFHPEVEVIGKNDIVAQLKPGTKFMSAEDGEIYVSGNGYKIPVNGKYITSVWSFGRRKQEYMDISQEIYILST